MSSGSVSPHSLSIAAGFHDDSVGDRQQKKQDGLGERGHVEIRYQREGARHTRQQGVRHVGASSGNSCIVPIHRDVFQGAADVGAKLPPRNAHHLRSGRDEWNFKMKIKNK